MATDNQQTVTTQYHEKTKLEIENDVKAFGGDMLSFLKGVPSGLTSIGTQEQQAFIDQITADFQANMEKVSNQFVSTIIVGIFKSVLAALINSVDMIAFVFGTAKALDEYGSQLGNETVRVTLPDVGDLMEYSRRNGFDQQSYQEIMSKYGYDDTWIERFQTLAHPLMTQAEILAGWLRGAYSDSETDELLGKHGWESGQIDIKKLLTVHYPDLGELITLRWFQLVSDDEFKTYARVHGWSPDMVENLYTAAQWIPSPVEALINARHGAFDQPTIDKWGLHNLLPDEFVPEMAKKGLTKQTALQYWAGHWSPVTNGAAARLFRRQQITQDQLYEIFHLNGIAQGAWPLEELAAYQVPEYFVLEAMVAQKPLDLETVTRFVTQMGYLPQDVPIIAQAFVAKGTASSTSAIQSQLEKAYKTGAISQNQAIASLQNIGLTEQQIEGVIQQIETETQIESTEELLKVIRHDYVEKFINEQEATTQMLAQGFASSQVDYFINLWRNERAMYKKRLTEAQVGKLFKDGYITGDVAVTKWVGMGYSNEDAQLLLKVYI